MPSTLATMPMFREVIAGDSPEVEQATQLVHSAADTPLNGFTVHVDGRQVIIPEQLGGLLARVIETVADGGVVQMRTMPRELTTTVAAEQLGVSRPTLMKMIKDGKIPSFKVGSHTRLLRDDVAALVAARTLGRARASVELMKLSDELGEQ